MIYWIIGIILAIILMLWIYLNYFRIIRIFLLLGKEDINIFKFLAPTNGEKSKLIEKILKRLCQNYVKCNKGNYDKNNDKSTISITKKIATIVINENENKKNESDNESEVDKNKETGSKTQNIKVECEYKVIVSSGFLIKKKNEEFLRLRWYRFSQLDILVFKDGRLISEEKINTRYQKVKVIKIGSNGF